MNQFTQYDPTALTEDLDLLSSDSIDNHNRKVINELPLEQRLSQLKNLGDDLWFFYEQQGDVEDLHMCIDFRSQLVALIPGDNPDQAVELHNLGKSHRVRYERLVNLEDLQKAIECQELAVSLISDNHHERPTLLAGLGSSLWRRFEHLGDFMDLEKAIEYQGQAVLLTPDGRAAKPSLLNRLGVSLWSRYEYTVDLSDIDHAIEYQRKAVSLAPDNDVGKPGFLGNLGMSLGSRFDRLGNLTDLDESTQCQQRAVELRSDSNEGKPRVLANLGNSFQRRFERLSDLADINKSIEFLHQAVLLSANEHIERAGFFGDLGTAYRIRGQQLGDLSDINRAIESQEKATQLIPDGHSSKSSFLGDIGSSYQSRFWLLSDLSDMDNAIKYHSLAASLRSDSHPGKPHTLTNLGLSHQSRFHHLGDIIDIDKAIDCQQKAVSLTPDNFTNKASFLNNLGGAFRSRAQSTRELHDIDSAIRCQQQAVSLTPDGSAEKPKFLCGLGDSYQLRFSHSNNLIDLETAIKYQRQAISSVPDNFAEKIGFLANLGSSCIRLFGYSNNLEDVDQGLEYYQQANTLTRDGSVEKPGVLKNIGMSFQHRFDQSHDLADVDKAIEYQKMSLSLLPSDHAQRVLLLQYLGDSYQIRFDQLGGLADIEYAIDYFRESATSTTGSALVAFESARLWIKLSARHCETPNLDAYRAAIDLIPRLVVLGTTFQRRYVDTVYLGDLVTEAAASAIALGQHTRALEWLEEGRSIVWGQRFQLRTPMAELRIVDAKLANQLELVGKSLETVGAFKVDVDWALDRPILPEDAAQQQRRLAASWSKLINQARQLPGFESFLKPKSLAQLGPVAERGPVIVVNVHVTRCDALVLLPNIQNITHVPLPSFSHKKAVQAQVNWTQSLQQHGVRDRAFIRPGNAKPGRGLFEYVLAQLWTEVVEPVFNHMGFLRIRPKEQLPHITWCATGPLAFLPIHAAGCFNKSRPQFKIYDYAITSYTPTLSGLLTPKKCPEDFLGILAVAQETTPGLSSLPCATEELERIQQAADGLPLKVLKGTDATIESVLKGMEAHAWVHLACHAIQDYKDPTDSALFLSDGKLSLAVIAQQTLKHGDLAFLSACQTAVGHRELPEEAIHLAAGMIMAGYTTVIGTMWSIKDKHAPLIAERVYASLLKGGLPDSRRAAKALHEAVAYLRSEVGEEKYEEWAPFIHIGI